MYHDNITKFNIAAEQQKQGHTDETNEMLSFSAEQAAGSLLRIADSFERIAAAYERMAAALDILSWKLQ